MVSLLGLKRLSKHSPSSCLRKYYRLWNTSSILQCLVILKVELLYSMQYSKILLWLNTLLWIVQCVGAFSVSGSLTYPLYWFMILRMMGIQFGRESFFINSWLILICLHIVIRRTLTGCRITFGIRCWVSSLNTPCIIGKLEQMHSAIILERCQYHQLFSKKAYRNKAKSSRRKNKKNHLYVMQRIEFPKWVKKSHLFLNRSHPAKLIL